MMKRFRTLRARFALATAALFLFILSVFGFYIYESVEQGLLAAMDNSLTLVAAQVIAGLETENNRLLVSDRFATEPENLDLSARGFMVRVLTPDGKLQYKFGPHPEISFSQAALGGASFLTIEPDATRALRLYTLPVEQESQRIATVQVARSLAETQATLRRLLTNLLVSVPLVVVVVGVSGYVLATRALAPIDRITRTARRISADDLSARLNMPPIDDEVGRLAETFDAMLKRLDASFQRERQFTADASHELRTPLAAMQAILGSVRAKRRSPQEYEQALDDLAEETKRLRALAENLMELARAQTSRSGFEIFDLSTLVRDVADSMEPLAHAKGLTLTREIRDSLFVSGDTDELIRLFVNVLDNAVKFTERGGITLSSDSAKYEIVVTITDTGIGIPAEALPHIFERFYRADQSRSTRGAGLGLAIAEEIARAHGGRIQVSSIVSKGTRVMIFLPEAAAQ